MTNRPSGRGQGTCRFLRNRGPSGKSLIFENIYGSTSFPKTKVRPLEISGQKVEPSPPLPSCVVCWVYNYTYFIGRCVPCGRRPSTPTTFHLTQNIRVTLSRYYSYPSPSELTCTLKRITVVVVYQFIWVEKGIHEKE